MYNKVACGTHDNTIRRKRFPCWLDKTRNSPSEYVNLLLSTSKVVTQPHLNVMVISKLLVFLGLSLQFDMLININHFISTHNTQTQIVLTK